MTNNDVLRRLRYTFNFNDNKMMALFALGSLSVTREQVSSWLKKDDDPQFVNCTDIQLASFLNGFIVEKRGKRDGEQPKAEKRVNNNILLTKLKIALALTAEDVVELLASVELRISKTELSAFFRKPDHKHFRQCKDQFLRNFLQGIDKKYHVARSEKFVGKPAIAAPVAVPDKEVVVKKSQYQGKKPTQSPDKSEERASYDKTARPQASKLYVNPNKSKVESAAPKRKVLKLKPEDIWGKQDK